MKRISLAVITMMLLIAGCVKETAGPLEGKWQLTQVEVNGNTVSVDTVFYNFQNTLFMLQVYHTPESRYQHRYGFSAVEKDSVHLELNSHVGNVENFLPLTDWTDARRSFAIIETSFRKLVLHSEGKKYTFRKY